MFGCGGASSSARNSAYASGSTMTMVRSSSVSSAAWRAASSTKSVRFLPDSAAAWSIRPPEFRSDPQVQRVTLRFSFLKSRHLQVSFHCRHQCAVMTLSLQNAPIKVDVRDCAQKEEKRGPGIVLLESLEVKSLCSPEPHVHLNRINLPHLSIAKNTDSCYRAAIRQFRGEVP